MTALHPNLSVTERWVRGAGGAVAVYLGTVVAGGGGLVATLAWIAGGVLLLTAAAGYCPVYDRLGIDSRPR